ncbi:hypothetical protein THRCLA_11625 [Thraustotheca clavata]|uniref:Fe2OG dioxygenase domain-containing protein n=1 Tax=Thraustotheca clavata TaxID=74557 RepID=A0A1V9Y766_9STRA|nr:hypothetical protein THRCLA_11625 [Thraustotheca clavata]
MTDNVTSAKPPSPKKSNGNERVQKHKRSRRSTRRKKKGKRPMTPISSLDAVLKGEISVTKQWILPSLVERLRFDAKALRDANAFTQSTIGGRVGEKQTMKQSKRLSECCGLFDDAVNAPKDVGDSNARDTIMSLISDLHATLDEQVTPLGDEMELQYLYYPGDDEGFYGIHIDQQERILGKANRIVSMVLYLNEPDWNVDTDGGSLCAYPEGKSPVTVDPLGGTLVVFHSEKLIHEARPTKRDRWALVGWFLEGSNKRQKT